MSARILVVDDMREICDLVQEYLSNEGYRVSTAHDGAGMRRALAQSPVDLVILNRGLPGEDGLSLAHSLRGETSIGIIMLTGRGETVDRILGLEAGADAYVPKPFHLRELRAVVQSVLRRASTTEAILNDLYLSEINASISWIWNDGFRVILGDPQQADGRTFPTIGEAVAWLRDQARAHYPDSEFARKYGGLVEGSCISPKPERAAWRASPSPNEPLDYKVLDSLRPLQREGRPDIVQQVISLFFKEAADLLKTLEEGAENKDAALLHRASRALEGASANVGAVILASRCKELEVMAQMGIVSDAAPIVGAILEDYRAVEILLSAHLPKTA